MTFNLIILRKGKKKEFFKGKKVKKRKTKKRRRQRKEKDRERKEDKKRKENKKEKKIKKGMHPCIPLHKIIDSISANYRNHNCQCSIYETNYLS